MALNTKTGAELLTALSDFIDDLWSRVSTSAGTSTTLVDTQLPGTFKAGVTSTVGPLIGAWIRFTSGTAGNIGLVSRITAYTGSTVTFSPAVTATASGDGYEIHFYRPQRKFAALDRARFPAAGLGIFRVRFDETTMADGHTREFGLPTTVRNGPWAVWVEQQLDPAQQWNFLTNPKGDSTSGWALAGAGATVSLYTYTASDREVPKYTSTAATLIAVPVTTVVTYTQVVGGMSNGITAAKAAGRFMTYAKWVYSRVAGRTALFITDDAATSTGTTHSGLGWELLTVTRTITGNNATTLSVGLTTSSGAVTTIGWQNGFFVYGDLPSFYNSEAVRPRVVRDGSIQRLMLPEIPPERRQLRIEGRDTLSALGTTVSTQITNTMELDDEAAEVLVALAARALFRAEGIGADTMPTVTSRIAAVVADAAERRTAGQFQTGRAARVKGPWIA